MKKVYIVSYGCIYESGKADSVFASREAARASIFNTLQEDKDERVKNWKAMSTEEQQDFINHVGYSLDRDELWTEEEPDFFTYGHDFMSIDEFDVQGE